MQRFCFNARSLKVLLQPAGDNRSKSSMSSPESRRGFRSSVTQLKLSTSFYGNFTAPDLVGRKLKTGWIWLATKVCAYTA